MKIFVFNSYLTISMSQQMLTYYELDLGLNHVVHKWSEATDPRPNLLMQVPGGQLASSDRFDGPSGVLVCCEDHIIYRHVDVPQYRVPIPHRKHPNSVRLFYPCLCFIILMLLNLIVSWERDLSNSSAYKFNGIL